MPLPPPRLPGSASPACRLHLPGCPVRFPQLPLPPPRLPGSASPAWPARPPRLPGSASPAWPLPPPRLPGSASPACRHAAPDPRFPGNPVRMRTDGGSPSLPAPLPPRETGWPSSPSPSPLRVSGPARNRSSASGWRALTGMRTLCRTRFPWSRGIFGPHRVLPRNVALVTEFLCSSTVHTQVVHRPRVDASVFSGLNVRRDAAAPRHDHHHLLAHVGPDADVRSEPPLRAALSFPPHVTPTKGALP